MCGFVGVLTRGNLARDYCGIDILSRMSEAIIHRGPDGGGHWADLDAGIGLAHRRLAIVDLTIAGHQPMVSTSGRYIIAFNGEIYNHLDLRNNLDSRRSVNQWRGLSDTETLLEAFEVWGIKSAVERCIGMFAFAVWDREDQVLTLCRDRLGEKPLYYGWQGVGDRACFLFGSELKALKVHPTFGAHINRDALGMLLQSNYVPSPHSIYNGIQKLQPGCLLTVSLKNFEPVIEVYWSLTEVALAGNSKVFEGGIPQAIDDLEDLLFKAVKRQMVADVPIGAFLSGGVDSSTVVAMMQAQSKKPVKTFTIGFSELDFNEAVYAKAVAKYLGTDHTELYVTPQQTLEVISKLPTLYCEPFADSSQIPTFLVSELARTQVKVSLSGDAGDELFAGYNRYIFAHNMWGIISRFPPSVRSGIAQWIKLIDPDAFDRLFAPIQLLIPSLRRYRNMGDKLHKAADLLKAINIDELHRSLVSYWKPHDIVIGSQGGNLNQSFPYLKDLTDVQRMMVTDSITYLPDDILVKVDRAAMGVSLEGRIPFLDHHVVEFAWSLQQSLKLRDGVGKWILRQVLYRYVPKRLIERPKMGFGVPVGSWLRGPLRDWAETLLEESRLRCEGYFNPIPIRKRWEEHLSGRRNWQYYLWSILMFQTWLENERCKQSHSVCNK